MVTGILSCNLLSCGAWGSNFENWRELSELFNGKRADGKASSGPKPEIIPANERRRAPLPVRLAVETSWQATRMAAMDPKELSCIFVSGIGDTQLTDYMCKELMTDSKQLSPTKFHNSVHNAAAGYWTISTGCERAANSVAAFQESVPMALMEAMVQCNLEAVPLLITFYDAPIADVLTDILGKGSAFSVSLIIAPDQNSYSKESGYKRQQITIKILPEVADWPELATSQPLVQELYTSSPAGRILSLLEKLSLQEDSIEKATNAASVSDTLLLPLGSGTSILISITTE
jgi:Beta-ketoacyl synthase, N-terminal domain